MDREAIFVVVSVVYHVVVRWRHMTKHTVASTVAPYYIKGTRQLLIKIKFQQNSSPNNKFALTESLV